MTDALIVDRKAIWWGGKFSSGRVSPENFPPHHTDGECDETQPFEGVNGEPLNVVQGILVMIR